MDRHAVSPAWGPEWLQEGGVRFRLWAPAAARLAIRIAGSDHAMQPAANGWFELELREAVPGTEYAFVLPGGEIVPDPASRWQPHGLAGPSAVVDATAYRWQSTQWRGRPWAEAVLYELHVGTFSDEGSFRAATEQLPELARLGITAIELMPVGQFPGLRGWGYDSVLPYAPHHAYGTPDDLKEFVDRAHGLGLMVMLDVVYNHFGPQGNYLHLYAPHFFDPDKSTPWGSAIAFDLAPVRRFFIDNALYWLAEFRFDGLRLDAIDQIFDTSEPHVLVELARTVRLALPQRHLHLVTEDSRNVTHLHRRQAGEALLYTAEWNDDFHNAAHVLMTGERDGYYSDFAKAPTERLARCLAEGFAFQGEPSLHAGGRPRGEDSTLLPVTAFVDFLQNHDQIGNRAHGERLTRLTSREACMAMSAILLLSPHVPLLFMGEEWGEDRLFLYFTDYDGELADAVREGRRREFAGFSSFGMAQIPDPNASETFAQSRLEREKCQTPAGKAWLEHTSALLHLRQQKIVPHLDDGAPVPVTRFDTSPGIVALDWHLRGALLQLRANFGTAAASVPPVAGEILHASAGIAGATTAEALAPFQIVIALEHRP